MPSPDRSAFLLDPVSMHATLRASIDALADTRRCVLRESRRRVSRKTEEQGAPYLGVLYELETPGRPSQWCYVKAFSRGQSAVAATAGAAHLPDLDALAWLLPADPVLAHLGAFLDPRRVRGVLRTLHGDGDTRDTPAAAQVVRHEPESHCTARFTFTLHGAARTVYGKTYAGDAWRAAAATQQCLAVAAAHADAFTVPLPLGASETLHAVWQAEATGAPLRAALAGPYARAWLDAVARGIARLQHLPGTGRESLAPSQLLARTEKQCAKLRRADASLGDALAPALAWLHAHAPAAAPLVLAHGDLHVDQLLCDGTRLVLFDYDNFAAASPVHDAADFASQILTDERFDAATRESIAGAFLHDAKARLNAPHLGTTLDWHLRALLLRKAYSFFVRHRSGWQARVRAAARRAAVGVAFPLSMEAA